MRNLLALLGFALVAFLGVGYYLDWYHVGTAPGATPGHQRIEIDINGKKIGADVERGVKAGSERVRDLLDGDKPTTSTAARP